MIDGLCTYVYHLYCFVAYKNSRILMHLLAYHGNCYSCNLAAERGLTR